jgi:hypothetical protein
MLENSPAFQRRDIRQMTPSPEGTAESNRVRRPHSSRRPLNPAFKRRAIIVLPSETKPSPVNNS